MVRDIIEKIVKYGFKNIELSGGTIYYKNLVSDLIELKEKYQLNYIIHNYFPPPKSDFVLNLASANEQIYTASIQHVKKAIELSYQLDVDIIGVHAGFLVDPQFNDLGNTFGDYSLIKKKKAFDRFCKAYKMLKSIDQNKRIYIENNVISHANFEAYHNTNPFLLTCKDDLRELASKVEFDFLLDIAHLKVSCNTLNLDFNKELVTLLDKTNYIHLSDNDGKFDSNEPIERNSQLFEVLKQNDFKNKTITLEIKQEMNGLLKTYELLTNL